MAKEIKTTNQQVTPIELLKKEDYEINSISSNGTETQVVVMPILDKPETFDAGKVDDFKDEMPQHAFGLQIEMPKARAATPEELEDAQLKAVSKYKQMPPSEEPKGFMINLESLESKSSPQKIEELTEEEKILDFLKDKKGYVKINDFLKSLYPLPKLNEPSIWMRQQESRRLKGLLMKMQSDGKITIRDNRHLQLGSHHYDNDGRQLHRNLTDWNIEIKISD